MKERFCNILKATGREGVDYVIEDLENWGFFKAPASGRGHGAYPGGLTEHSLNVYDAAMDLRKGLLERRPDLEPNLSEESVAIAALLHDVCKAKGYRLVHKKRKNSLGMYEDCDEYEYNDDWMPVGHGEKSVILLLPSIDLTDDEIMAIRWHMGPWNLGKDEEKAYRMATRQSALQTLIHAADTVASALYERDAPKL